jgi:hypothetical protein
MDRDLILEVFFALLRDAELLEEGRPWPNPDMAAARRSLAARVAAQILPAEEVAGG